MRIRTLVWSAAAMAAIGMAGFLPFALRDTAGPGGMPRHIAYKPLPDRTQALSRITFGSSAAQDRPQPVLDVIRLEGPDLFIFMGDNVYGDVHDNAPSADLLELRHAYGRLARRGEFRRFIHDVPVLAIWDDRDLGLNDGGADFELRDESERLFRRFWAVEKGDPRSRREGLYYARTFGPPGKRVQIILLDTRSFRSPLKQVADWKGSGRRGYVADDDPAKTMLGEDQWAWLEQQLLKPAELRLIVSSIQIIAEGHRFEKWANLPMERQRLFDLIALTGAEGVIFLSGDRHAGGLYEYAQGTPYPFYEITSSSLNRPLPGMEETAVHQLGAMFGEVNFGLIDVDWAGRQVTVGLRDARGRPVDGRVLTVGFDSLRPA